MPRKLARCTSLELFVVRRKERSLDFTRKQRYGKWFLLQEAESQSAGNISSLAKLIKALIFNQYQESNISHKIWTTDQFAVAYLYEIQGSMLLSPRKRSQEETLFIDNRASGT